MRDIKFRGLSKDDEWIYGDLVHQAFDGILVHEVGIKKHGNYPVFVIPETVGQFTGLTDANGVEIYEGDIIKIGSTNDIPDYGVVKFIAPCFLIESESNGVEPFFSDDDEDKIWFEVCGNIHQNPELITGDLK